MMTFTSEQLATLRKIAQQATQGEWRAFISPDTGTYAVHTPGDERCGDIIKWPGFDGQKNAENNAEFIAAFNPKLVLALLDELDKWQQESSAWQAVAEKQLALAEDAENRISELEAREVVPDEMTPKQASRSYCGEVRGYRDGWNACRAAMLQGDEPVTDNTNQQFESLSRGDK